MNRQRLFSMALAAATAGLTACGGGNDVTPVASVACEAPDVDELRFGRTYVSACVPASSGPGASRYDAQFSGSGAYLVKVDFSNASCTGEGTQEARASATMSIADGTTTVAALGADGVTSVTGAGRTVTLGFVVSNGTFPSGTPLISAGSYVLCKSTPASTSAMRTVSSFQGDNGSSFTFTPTFALRASNVDGNAINTNFGFDGGGMELN